MSTNNKQVSIITPTYNSAETIADTADSIINQSHSNWEWLITDDCSTDDTYKKLLELSSQDSRIKVFRNTVNSGAATSRNNSLSHISGDFIAFIDSDDIWLPNKLNKQLNFMQSHNLNFSFTAYELIDAENILLNKSVDIHAVKQVNYEDMLKKKVTLGCSTVMLRSKSFPDISMPLLRTGQDYALWLSLLKQESYAYKLNEVLTQYRILPNSISRNKVKKAKRQWQIYREIEKLSFIKSMYCFSFYAYRAIFRK